MLSKRSSLKTLTAVSSVLVAGNALPLSWSKPIVKAIILPLHAQTTGSGCDLAAGCYAVEANNFMSWPGGSGPHLNVPGGHQTTDCSDQIPSQAAWSSLVIAKSMQEATAALDAISFTYSQIILTPIQPAELSDGCFIFAGL